MSARRQPSSSYTNLVRLVVMAAAVVVFGVVALTPGTRPAALATNAIPPVTNSVGPASTTQCPPSGCIGKPSELGIPQVDTGNAFQDAIDILSILAGILSVIFLVLGGIRYSTSGGDSSRVASAKQTITYAIVGLVVSLIAPFIVGYVITQGPH